jgi:maleate isomerase
MVIMARSARLGFLIPPGNPTVEPEMIAMAPKGVSVHFSRMVARGPTGTLEGQDERNRTQIAHIGESAELLAMVKPDVIMLAHTATSYTLGRHAEAQLVERLRDQCGTPVATAFGSVVAALEVLGATRVALGTPYSEETTLKGKALLEEHGLQVVSHGRLDNVTNIYDETPERARALGRAVDAQNAQAVFLSGLGMPTISILDTPRARARQTGDLRCLGHDVGGAALGRSAQSRVRLRPAVCVGAGTVHTVRACHEAQCILPLARYRDGPCEDPRLGTGSGRSRIRVYRSPRSRLRRKGSGWLGAALQ